LVFKMFSYRIKMGLTWRKNAYRCGLHQYWRMIDFFPLRYASFKKWQFYNRSRSLWLGRWWWSLGVLRVTKFGKTKFYGIKWVWWKRVLGFSNPSDTHCVTISSGFSFMSIVGVIGWIWQISDKSLFTSKDTIRSFLTPFSPILRVFMVVRHFRVLTFYWVMGVYGDGSFCFAKSNQWMFMRKRSEQFDPHRFLNFNFCFD
jgi:hypothetical protein